MADGDIAGHVPAGGPDARTGAVSVASSHGAREAGCNKTMRTACKAAGIPHFHPHDLRHRRCSLWHGRGIPAREIGERVGQQQIAVTLDTYTHVMPLDEVPTERLRALLAAGTPPREVPARSQRA